MTDLRTLIEQIEADRAEGTPGPSRAEMEAALIAALRVLVDVRKFLPKTQWALPAAAFAKELDRLIEAVDALTKGKT